MLAAALGTALVVSNLSLVGSPAEHRDDQPFVQLYSPPRSRAEVVINQGDGQAFAALAQDPALRRPLVFAGDELEASYRAQRPMLGWLGWLLSGGRAALVPVALLVVTVASFAGLGAVAVHLSGSRGLFVVLLPGSIIVLDKVGPEAIAAAAILGALTAWERGRPGVGALLLSIAALARETSLVACAAVAAVGLLRGNSRRSVAWLGVPAVLYAGWSVVVRWRYGQWPTGAAGGRIDLPFRGVVEAAAGWSAGDYVIALAGFAAVAAAVVKGRDIYSGCAAAFCAVSTLLGPWVWSNLQAFGRVLLPMWTCAVLSLVMSRRRDGGADTIDVVDDAVIDLRDDVLAPVLARD